MSTDRAQQLGIRPITRRQVHGAFDLAGDVEFNTGGGTVADTLGFSGTSGNDIQSVGNSGGQSNDLSGVEKYKLDGGDDVYRFTTTLSSLRVADTAGVDTLDFSQADAGVLVNLSKSVQFQCFLCQSEVARGPSRVGER